MDQKVNPIQPPPSVDDLLALGAEARLGQVDFAHRLVPATDAAAATVTSVVARPRPVAAVPQLPVEIEAVIEPVPDPEPVAAPEVEAAAVEPVVVEPAPEPAATTTPAAALAPKAKPAPRSRPKPAAKAKPASKKKPPESPKLTEPVVEPVIPAILPIANLSGDAVSASAAYDDEFYGHEVPATRIVADTAPTLRIPVEPMPAPVPVPAPVVDASVDFGGTVQEVADAAIERLRDAENATLQHLAALEAEAARRAELLTAQAELDAELIRITARREAHAIISAARSQAGLGAPSSRDARQLAEISDAVSRFAESIESTLTPMHAHPSQGDQA